MSIQRRFIAPSRSGSHLPSSSPRRTLPRKKRNKKRKVTQRNETHMYIFYGVSSYRISEPKGTIAIPPPPSPLPLPVASRARYIVGNILFFYSYYLIFICATFRFLFVSTLFSTLINEFVKNNPMALHLRYCSHRFFFFLLLSIGEHYVKFARIAKAFLF